jgi:hypothetical protein
METCFVTAMGFALVTRGREEPLPIAIRSGAASIVAWVFPENNGNHIPHPREAIAYTYVLTG